MTHDHGNRPREVTLVAIVFGLILSVVMGAANVYLGLRVGMTVSASIPAAVLAMALLNGVMRRKSILEANLVQTGASAGESLAAGIIFTVPALVLVKVWPSFDYWTTTLIAFSGGLLGVLFMIPMRRVFVVDNHELQYPEGVACAEVLRAGVGSEGESTAARGATTIFAGLAVGALFKVCQSYLGLLKNSVEYATVQADRVFYFGTDVAPALLGVGLIVGLPIAIQIFTGGAIAWLVTIPLISSGIAGATPVEDAWQLWADQVRYMGVGAMLVGGLVSIWKVRGGLVAAVSELTSQFRPDEQAAARAVDEPNLDSRLILGLSILTIALIAGVYQSLLGSVGITLLTVCIMVTMSFFFTAVASYIVGLVGNSNSPVSGMTITSVLATGGLISVFRLLGLIEADSTTAIVATLGVAGIVCCVACTAGDVCNDLKTGHLIGASPRSQQIMQVLGVLVAAFVMAPVMTALHEGSLNEGTGGIGGKDLVAPQAVLFSELARGFFGDGKLPWNMVVVGVGIGFLLVVADGLLALANSTFRLHVMPVAVGMYLPFNLSVPILLGGLMHFSLARRFRTGASGGAGRGVLVASGVIAGESLVGVAVGILAYLNFRSHDFATQLGLADSTLQAMSLGAILSVAAWMYWMSSRRSN